MSNKKDLSVITKALEGVIVNDCKTLAVTNDTIINNTIKQVRFFVKRSFEDTMNIGYWLMNAKAYIEQKHPKDNSERWEAFSHLYGKCGITKRTANNYISVVKGLRELDTKKALDAYKTIEQTKLYELSKLGKNTLTAISQDKYLLEEIKNTPTRDFKNQILPALVKGEVEQTSRLLFELEQAKKNRDIAETEKITLLEENRALNQNLTVDTPKIISDIKTKTFAYAESAGSEIELLQKIAISITKGRQTKEFDLCEQAYRVSAMSELMHSAKSLLATASEFHNYVMDNFSINEIEKEPLSDEEIEQAKIEYEKRKQIIKRQQGNKYGI